MSSAPASGGHSPVYSCFLSVIWALVQTFYIHLPAAPRLWDQAFFGTAEMTVTQLLLLCSVLLEPLCHAPPTQGVHSASLSFQLIWSPAQRPHPSVREPFPSSPGWKWSPLALSRNLSSQVHFLCLIQCRATRQPWLLRTWKEAELRCPQVWHTHWILKTQYTHEKEHRLNLNICFHCLLKWSYFRSVVPNLFGTRDQFHGRQFCHSFGNSCFWWSIWS